MSFVKTPKMPMKLSSNSLLYHTILCVTIQIKKNKQISVRRFKAYMWCVG
nr:MAG TPA: hypothetical protein [Bacteriophage sp.]